MVKAPKKSSVNLIDNAVGWMGVIFVLGAYSLVSFDVVNAQTITFQGLMLLGSLGIMLVAYRRHDMQPLILNFIFALIAFISLMRILFYL